MSTELVCAIVAGLALLKGLAIGWFAGVQRGLYLGEKGRRQAAESMLVLGVPEAGPARRVNVGRVPPPIEPKIAPKGYDEKTIQRGAEIIIEEHRASGRPVPSMAEAREMAGTMLSSGFLGGEDDIAIPGLGELG